MKDRHAPPPKRGPGWPNAEDDVINTYGTYEVQATADADNRYPMIAQGISPEEAKTQLDEAERWKNKK